MAATDVTRLIRPLDAGRVLDGSFSVGRARFWSLAALSLIVAVPLQAAVGIPFARALDRAQVDTGVLTEDSNRAAAAIGLGFVVALAWWIAPSIELGIMARASVTAWVGSDVIDGLGAVRPLAVAGAIGRAFLLGAGALVAGIVLVALGEGGKGALMIALVGLPLLLLLAARYAFAPVEAAFGASARLSIKGSKRLTRRSHMRVVGLGLASNLVCLAVLAPLLPFVFGIGPSGGAGRMIWQILLGVLFQILSAPFRVSLYAGLWLDLRCRREGLDLALRAGQPVGDALSR